MLNYRIIGLACLLLSGCNLFTQLESFETNDVGNQTDMARDQSNQQDQGFDASVVDTYRPPWPLPDFQVLVVVADPMDTTVDQPLLNHLRVGLNLDITLADDDGPTATDGFDAVIVAESSSSSVLAMQFRDAPVPVFSMEPFHWEGLGMTTSGTTLFSDTVTVDASAIPSRLTDGDTLLFSGQPADTVRLGFGLEPTTDAQIIASVAAGPSALVYETGSELIGLTAPARRVGFGLFAAGYPYMTTAAWDLLDACVLWTLGYQELPTTRDVYLVTANDLVPGASDAHIRSRLYLTGHDVFIGPSSDVTMSTANEYAVTLVSASASPTFQDNLKGVASGVVVLGPQLLPVPFLGLSDLAQPPDDQGHLVWDLRSSGQLAGGFDGSIEAYLQLQDVGAPATSTLGAGAKIVGEFNSQALYFVYDSNDQLADDTPAAGRRAYFAVGSDSAQLSQDGLTIWDAMVDWSAE